MVADMMLRMKKELSLEDENKVSEIDNLILIDRTVDMVTPMCIPLTYEGLIDEIFGIHYGLFFSPSFLFLLLLSPPLSRVLNADFIGTNRGGDDGRFNYQKRGWKEAKLSAQFNRYYFSRN